MASRSKPTPSRREVWFGALLVAALSCLAWGLKQPGQFFDHVSFDLPVLLRYVHPIPTSNAVIVAIDEPTLRNLGSIPEKGLVRGDLLDRRLHVELLHRLRAAGAQAVVFDLLFDHPWPEPNVDQELAQAMAQSSNVVIAAKLLHDDHSTIFSADTPAYPLPLFAEHAHVGFAVAGQNEDQVLRWHFQHPQYTNIAWATAKMLGRAPDHYDQPRWINYYGDRAAVETLSYFHVLDPTLLPPDLLAAKVSGKVVFVGGSREDGDQHATPFTEWTGRKTAGVEIQATIFLNLWRRDWLQRLSPLRELGLLALCGLCLGGFLTLGQPKTALICAALSAVAVIAGALIWLEQTREWFAWFAIVGLQIPLALVWSIFHQTQRSHTPAPALSLPSTAPSSRCAPSASTPAIPDHELLQCVGRGGYGEVWLARNAVGGYHAVKIIRRSHFEAQEPYDRELRGVQKFMPISRGHPGWVPILHVGRNDAEQYFYYVMEIADDDSSGREIHPATYRPRTLAGVLRQQTALSFSECRELGLQLSSALDYLHHHQYVHRDVKPSNIVYVQGKPRFVDIGLVTDAASIGHDTSFVGTQAYLSPEGPGSPQADVYALGKVLYQAMSGLDASLYPELPTQLVEEADTSGMLEFFTIVAKACEPDRSQRYGSAQALHDALQVLSPAP